MIVLEIQQPGSGEVRMFTTQKDIVTLGRHSSNDVHLSEESVSRFHAEIERRGEVYYIRDQDSKNGVYVNNQPVLEYPLSEGDEIAIGEVGITFHTKVVKAPPASDEHTTMVFLAPHLPPAAVSSSASLSSPTLQSDVMAMPPPGQMLREIIRFNETATKEEFDPAFQRALLTAARLCEVFIQAVDVDSLLDRAMTILSETIRFSRGVILLWNPDTRSFEPRLIRHSDPEKTVASQIAVSMTIVNMSRDQRQGICCSDAQHDARFASSESVHNLRLRSVICVPIWGSEAMIGVIHLDAPAGSKALNKRDLPVAMLIANTLAQSIETFLAREERRQNERRADQIRVFAAAAHSLRGLMALTEGQEEVLKEAAALGNRSLVEESVNQFIESRRKVAQGLETLLSQFRGRTRNYVMTQINDLISQLLDELSPTLEAKGVRYEFSPDPSIPASYFDPDALRHVFLNLFNNSIEAMEDREEKILQVGVERLDEVKIRIYVQDNGKGMSADVLSHAFEPFFTTRGPDRAGLGLTYSRHLLSIHGGTIDCQSEPDIGATVVVSLPLRTAPPTVAPSKEISVAPWLLGN